MNAPATNSRECQFCLAWFSRVDATRRHAKRCPQRKGRILLGRKRGRLARSCDQCSRVKVHCNPGDEGPCERCIPRGLSCTFNRHDTSPTVLDPSPEESFETGRQHVGRIPLSFLLNFTDDHQDYLTEEAIGIEPDVMGCTQCRNTNEGIRVLGKSGRGNWLSSTLVKLRYNQ
jgi:hypothetical protein